MFRNVCIGVLVVALVSSVVEGGLVWPVPASMQVNGDALPLAHSFTLSPTSTSTALLDSAIKRYSKIIGVGSSTSGDALKSLDITVQDSSQALTNDTDYSYTLRVTMSGPYASIVAKSVYGAMQGMETFSQLVSNGQLDYNDIAISDAPSYIHRGLLVDSGRRFINTELLKNIIDGMSFSRLNVLHLHLSDYAGVRFQVAGLSELTNDLDGQFYTPDDAAQLVYYARERGIRIVAEVDVPGHSGGFRPLEAVGLKFCSDAKVQLANDETTYKLVTKVLSAVYKAFPDVIFHLGGDETKETPDCSYDDIHKLEKELQAFIINLGGRPMTWNEVYSVPATSVPNGALENTIIQNWHGEDMITTTKAGYTTVNSLYNQQYLDQQCCLAGEAGMVNASKATKQCYYVDIASGVTAPNEKALILGGEAAMWSDLYCPSTRCPNEGPFSWMYGPEQDDVFAQSFSNMVWPRAAASGGAFWNYQPDVASSPDYAARIAAHNDRLTERGIITCPTGCHCDWASKCGKLYGKPEVDTMKVTLVNKCDFNVNIREVQPCQRALGTKLAQLKPNETYVAEHDFVVWSVHGMGDYYDEWFGGPGWRFYVQTLDITYNPKDPNYLYMMPPTSS